MHPPRNIVVAYIAMLLASLATTRANDVSLGPIEASIENISTDKLRYRPGETGAVRMEIKNHTARPLKFTVEAILICELADRTPLPEKTIELSALESKPVVIPFTADRQRFGCEARIIVRANPKDPPIVTSEVFFSVADNFYDVGIGGTTSPIMSDKPELLKSLLETSRKNYCNWFDVFFWAPDDWAMLVSPLDRWWSGQTSYRHVEANLKAFIDDCHANGIALAAYASCNPAGPFGWECARQHPEWFFDSAGQFPMIESIDVDALDHWNDPAWRAGLPKKKKQRWLRIPVDLRRLDALDFGIDQLIASAKHYGWDGVRFDGHYTIPGSDELSTRNMRRLKEKVWRADPDFRFGFNYGRAPEWRGGVTHEMREAMAGGGMYMQEGIRNFRYTAATYESWQHYATNELRVAKQIQSIGGSYHCIWFITAASPREQSAYKLIYGLIAGGHPAYGSGMFAPGCENWGAFMTRWSAFLWDRAIRQSPEDAKRITVTSANPIFWEPLVQSRIESAERRYLIVHLVNPSPSDEIAKTTYPPPAKNVTVHLNLDPRERVERVTFARPDSQVFDTELKPSPAKGGVDFNVAELKLWGMLIVELHGNYAVPSDAKKFSEPPDEAKIAAALAQNHTGRIVDPSKPVQAELAAGERIWPTDRGFSGVGPKIEPDDQAVNSAAQTQSWENQNIGGGHHFLGETYLGPLAAGRYRLGYHVKWTDGGNIALWRVHAYVRGAEKGKKQDLAAADYSSPNAWEQSGAAPDEFLGGDWRNKRQKLGPAGAYQFISLEFDLKVSSYIHANLMVETDRQGPAKFYLDHIQTTQLELYSDIQQAQWSQGSKAAGLRSPNGTKPEKWLLIKGPFSQLYRVSSVCAADESYPLPDKYETLYGYDAVLLANVDLTESTYAQRKMLKDFVEDGGRLVILGGVSTFGQGGMKGSYLEDLSPIKLKASHEVVADAPPAILGFHPGQPAADHPAIFWHHDVTYRPDAVIIAYAGDRPIAAMRATGKGKVYVFTGTVLGDRRQDFTAFWETKTWLDLLTVLAKK